MVLIMGFQTIAHADRTELPDNTTTLFKLFGSMCWSSMGNYQAIDSLLSPKKLPQLNQSQAKPFLVNQAGKAWPIVLPQGSYVLAVTENDICSVFAKQADPSSVNAKLAEMIEQMTQQGGFKLAQKQKDASKTGDSTTTSYLLKNNDDASDLAISIVLTTSDSAKAVAQAMLSFSIVESKP